MPSGSTSDGQHAVIGVGASAGGLEGLRRLARGLPAGLPAAVLVVLHIPPHARSLLPDLLDRAGPLPAAHAQDGEPLLPGRIYVAPPDRHLLVERRGGGTGGGPGEGVVRLSSGPRENYSRPAVDPLLRSAALAFGPRVVGVVLSGALSDGTAGLWEVKQRGGVAVVQDPGEAAYPSMPHSALDQVPVDHVLPVAEMPALLTRLAAELSPRAAPEGRKQGAMASGNQARGGANADEKPGSGAVERDTAAQVAGARDGAISVYVCPDCGGTLWQADAGPFTRFRCHVGHVYGGADLLEGLTTDMERSMWYVVRSLRDKANLARQLATAARGRGDEEEAAGSEERARFDDEQSAVVERMITLAADANRGQTSGR